MPEEKLPKQNKNMIRESLPRLLGLLDGVEKIELEQVALDIGDLEFFIPTGTGQFDGRAASMSRLQLFL